MAQQHAGRKRKPYGHGGTNHRERDGLKQLIRALIAIAKSTAREQEQARVRRQPSRRVESHSRS